ncbi:MFS transporter [Myxosarcina sp. GI1]|uniref:MFS transporter n=1 Tax=Myxosarcina sp. GI1 TaxID=1541065 RepID=UPI00056243D8|nr:MFS transporter [Myxosarcina sp. GI1]
MRSQFLKTNLKSNLVKLYVLNGLAFAWFPIPTIVLFYQSHGLNIEQTLLLKTILSISILVLEVPSGYIADIFGRKACLVAGSGVWIVGWLIYGFCNSFYWFALAEVLAGVAGSLISGADTAIAYDSLVELKRENFYPAFAGRLVAVAGVSEAVSGIIGAAIAETNLAYPFFLQTACLIIYFFLAITLVEPERHDSIDEPKIALKQIILETLERPPLRWLILLSATFSTASFLMVWLSQAYLEQINLPVRAFGIVWAVFHLLMSLASVFADRVERVLGIKRALLGLVLLLASSYLLLATAYTYWGILFIVVVYMVRGMVSPLILNVINRQTVSSVRATVLSLNSFAFRLSFAIVSTTLSAIASNSLAVEMAIAGGWILIAGSWCWWRLVKLQLLE